MEFLKTKKAKTDEDILVAIESWKSHPDNKKNQGISYTLDRIKKERAKK